MGILEDYPYCRDIIESEFLPLTSSAARQALYVRTNNERFVFENPIYSTAPRTRARTSTAFAEAEEMGTKDFLASIPAFANFSDAQLSTLEQKAAVTLFPAGEIIFRQGDDGDKFYVIQKGAVDVLIQDSASALQRGDLGRVVNRLTAGCYFGERALMRSEPRAASIRTIGSAASSSSSGNINNNSNGTAQGETGAVCLVFSRSVYEEIISGGNALLGQDTDVDVDWSKDHETRSLFKHIEGILEIEAMDSSPKIKRILYELSTAFTPELSPDEVIARMVMTVKVALKVDRVGLFVLSEDKRSMVLKVSERAKGIRLPIRGLAGAVLQSNTALNIADAYQDARFDATMDRRTGYRTRQVLGVPLRDPLTGAAMGLLQVNNRVDGTNEAFSAEHQRVLELAAEQLSELLLGRAEVFIHTGIAGAQRSVGQGVGDGLVVLNSAEQATPFTMDLFSFSLGPRALEMIARENIMCVEVQVSLHLALHTLCTPQRLCVDGTARNGSLSSKRAADMDFSLQGRERLTFDIDVKDLPRSTRILFKLIGFKKKRAPPSSSSGNGDSSANTGGIFLGWAACTIFDFKACMDCVEELCLFPPLQGGEEVSVPIHTTLNNVGDASTASLGAILAPDLVLARDSMTPRVRIVHSTPQRAEMDGVDRTSDAQTQLTEAQQRELDRLLQLSFNPLSMHLITQADKAFLWGIRYALFTHAHYLPALVMCTQWNRSEHVQELYDLLDLWAPATPIEALQLLDRRFMDPKVRAYAVHCLEDLPDDELSLYMLQLCQQLKFENFVDSALARFLLRRALTNQKLIGHIYFWLLQSEVYNKDVSKRFIILLQVYIRNCGSHRIELGQQMFVMKRLENVAEEVKKGESKEERKQILHKKLSEIVLPATFKLPLNPSLTVCGFEVKKCRVMESKKKPLWLTLKDANGGKDVVLMLKVGDDLRQDALIIQLLRVMNDLWKREGLDMQMQLYDCISTGYERGLLQVVLNATTLGSILMDATDKQSKSKGSVSKSGTLSRKLGAAMKALSDFSVLGDWLREQVEQDMPDSDAEARAEEYEERVQSFMISTAAYCVASYVLGLGDRHNDNLMLTRSGHFFHIDFGHILGNFKSKYGVKRERAPFVFTHAMKAVMCGDGQYEAFVDLCCDVYNILRENAVLLVSLFSLAIPCNLPELQEEKDVMWVYEKLLVGATDEEATAHFKKTLDIALNTRGTRMNDAVHMLAHA